METASLICLLIIAYTYLGYPVLIWLGARVKELFRSPVQKRSAGLPSVTVIIPAYNEAGLIEKKLQNCFALDYPADKLSIVVVTDGSVDETPAIVARDPRVLLLHSSERKGKIKAIEHAMQRVQSDLVVFTDANTLINAGALHALIMHFNDAIVGAVAGEKRLGNTAAGQAMAGEGWYWHYESFLKKTEADFYSVMGAAGELICIRRELFEPLPDDTLLDDLAISLELSLKGYRIRYEAAAFATEPASQNIAMELERKTRIAAGGWQSLQRYGPRLLLTRPLLAFEYISHRALRWVLVPYLLLSVFVIGLIWVAQNGFTGWPGCLFAAQLIFYLFAFTGWIMERMRIRAGWFFAPFYFCFMHYAMIAGLVRYCMGRQNVLWKKAAR